MKIFGILGFCGFGPLLPGAFARRRATGLASGRPKHEVTGPQFCTGRTAQVLIHIGYDPTLS